MYYHYQNTKVYFQKFGTQEKSILILPGWGDTACTFREQIQRLKDFYTVYIIDYPGFGKSPPLFDTWTIYQYGKMIVHLIKDLRITPSLVIAHSFGGRLAILLNGYFQIKFPKILLIGSAGIKPKKTFRSLIKKYSYRILKKLGFFLPKKQKEKYLAYLFQKYASSDYYNLPLSMRSTFQQIIKEDLRKYLPSMDSEVLLLWGEEDRDTPLRDAYIMRKKIKNSELIVLKRSGHFVYLDHPYLVLKIIFSFLEN